MIASDKISNTALENQVQALGNAPALRAAVKLAYELGRCDGALAGIANYSERLAANREAMKDPA